MTARGFTRPLPSINAPSIEQSKIFSSRVLLFLGFACFGNGLFFSSLRASPVIAKFGSSFSGNHLFLSRNVERTLYTLEAWKDEQFLKPSQLRKEARIVMFGAVMDFYGFTVPTYNILEPQMQA
ncbi:MAG: hypothetical protein NXY57DRAFT_1035391 [Lentinula lateritia]|nr:MAG: hypothetical protein NXY57DRAFT_1035391 [Lentinula lateritia]